MEVLTNTIITFQIKAAPQTNKNDNDNNNNLALLFCYHNDFIVIII